MVSTIAVFFADSGWRTRMFDSKHHRKFYPDLKKNGLWEQHLMDIGSKAKCSKLCHPVSHRRTTNSAKPQAT